MSQTVSAAITPVGDIVATEPSLTADFDARWAAWQERGRVQDRSFRRKLWIAVPAVVIVAATAYTLLTR